MTLGHFVYWIVMTMIRQQEVVDHPMFKAVVSDINILTTSIVVVLLGLFYHLSTEVTYKKLEIANVKNETLLKEIHHRLKNNLNVISSILGLQILNLEKDDTKSAKVILLENKVRIEAIAMIHESLYKNGDIEKVVFKDYTQHLSELMNGIYNDNVSVDIESNNLTLPLETMFQLGIILSELLTNSNKHAFKDLDKSNEVKISLSRKKDSFHFTYRENHNDHVDIEKMLKSQTLGMRLIQLTAKQMDASLNVTQDDGLIFTIDFFTAS